VIGGGFGGAACAARCARSTPKWQVTLIEPIDFRRLPLQQRGDRGPARLEAQQFGYERIAADGVDVVAKAAAKIDPQARSVGLADGASLSYDRLVLAPASISGSTPCRAMTRLPRPKCRTPGKPVNRPCCCAGNSKPWRMAGWWRSWRRRDLRAVRRRRMSAPA